MTYVPHLRVSMAGTLPGPEIFSMSLSMAFVDVEPWENLLQLEPNDTQWDDIVADCVAFFGRAGTGITTDAVLKTVKIARIGANGLYAAPIVERAANQPGGQSQYDALARKPNQVALAVTLHTDADLGRVKGRFYLPSPYWGVGDDGRITSANAESTETSVATLLNDLANEPGIDVLNLKPVVASQGRTRNNVQVLPPGNHEVTGVSVGRTLDTVRRRRNKVPEGRTVTSLDL